MSRALALTQRQVKALCEGAKKAGYAPIVQFGNVLVRLVPDRTIHKISSRKRLILLRLFQGAGLLPLLVRALYVQPPFS